MIKEQERNEIEEKFKWDLSFLYKDEKSFYDDLDELKKYVLDINLFKDKILENENTLYDFLELETKIDDLITNLYVYASSLSNEDVSNSKYQKMQMDILGVASLYSEVASFVMPEMLSNTYDKVDEFINKKDELKKYESTLKDIYRYKKYTLNNNEEKLMSYLSDLQSKFENNFSVTLNSIIDFGIIKDEDGNDVKLNLNNYVKYIRSTNRDVRKAAYLARGINLEKYLQTLAIDYEGYVKADVLSAKARNYESSLQKHLYADYVTPKLYDNLLKIANDKIDVLHKFYHMKKELLGYEELQPYDLSTPLSSKSNKKYSVEDAKKIILESLSLLGKEYNNVLKEAFDNRWIDFMPTKNKCSGYYETMAAKGNPIILANYTEDFDSVSALAHELGHAVHSYYSHKNQPSFLSSYSIFVAEVISLTNEILLSNYIVKNSNDKLEKLHAIENILNVFSNNFFGTLTEGSIFEKIVHERLYNGESLNEEDFNEIFDKILDKHYGNVVKKAKYDKYNWSMISHFYSPFYYYKYAIGISCACFVAKKIMDGEKDYLDKYFEFIKLGSSKTPLEELKVLDIDLTKEDVIIEAINYFDSLIDEFKKLYNEK